MTKTKPTALTLSLLCIGIASSLGQGEPPTIEAVFANTKPKLDAVIGPGEWDSAEPSVIEHVLRAGEDAKPTPHYQFRLLWDDDALYMLFETDLTNWPGGTGGFGGNNNINFYIDPNNDDEENGTGPYDGYHPVLYPDTGKTSRFDSPFDPGFRTMFHEAAINANFGGSPWPAKDSQEEGTAIDYVSEIGPRGAVIEICFPWKLFDSEAGDNMEIFHTDPPEIDDKWYVNVCLISALGDLPTWSWTPGQFFAQRPHGEVTFVANPVKTPIFTSYDSDADEYSVSWDSTDGLLYNLRSETDLEAGEPATWPIFAENQDLVATPPTNTVTFPLTDDPVRFFVLETFPAPPVSIFGQDFEGGQEGWTVGSDGADGTAWEFGSPSAVGPPAAHSGDNCFGTNLSGDYGMDADIWLRSPEIDLTTAGGATLIHWEFKDIEEGFDAGSIRVYDAADDSELAVLDDSIDGVSDGWEEASYTLPPEALGKTVYFCFRFTSDDLQNFAGWYIDNVEVTVP